jgi:hypothetical protein
MTNIKTDVRKKIVEAFCNRIFVGQSCYLLGRNGVSLLYYLLCLSPV